jgi:hypothetical protein
MSGTPRFQASAHAKRPLLKVIREKCIDCSGGSLAEVRRCPVTGCALHPHRMARDPFARPRGPGATEKKPPSLGRFSGRNGRLEEGEVTVLGGRKVNTTGRATGALRTNRRTKIAGQFAARTIEMLESPAFRVLSLSARRVLDRIEIELAHHGGQDNGKLPVTYEHFHEYGIHRHAIGPGIRECVTLGFVEITETGRGGNAEFRRPNLFRLTYKHAGSVAPTEDWRKIETIEGAEALARAARTTFPKKCDKLRDPQKLRVVT